MKKLLYLGLLSVCVLLGSCVEKNVSNVFDKVERYMDVYPDSALLSYHLLAKAARVVFSSEVLRTLKYLFMCSLGG